MFWNSLRPPALTFWERYILITLLSIMGKIFSNYPADIVKLFVIHWRVIFCWSIIHMISGSSKTLQLAFQINSISITQFSLTCPSWHNLCLESSCLIISLLVSLICRFNGQQEYKIKEKIGTLKKCGHGYHCCCVKKWLSVKNSCPICKASAHDDSSA